MAVIVGLCYAVFGFYVGQGLYKLGIDEDRRLNASHRQWIFYVTGAILMIAFTLLFGLTARGGANFAQDLRKKSIKALLNKDISFFDENSSGDLSTKLGTDCR